MPEPDWKSLYASAAAMYNRETKYSASLFEMLQKKRPEPKPWLPVAILLCSVASLILGYVTGTTRP